MSSPRVKTRISRVSRGMGSSANAELRRLLGSDAARDISIRTGARRGVLGPAARRPSFPPMPVSWLGTLPEWAIYWAHLALDLEEDQDFAYQYGIDDSTRVDFFEFDLELAIEIAGLYWHYGFGAAQQVNDLERRIRLESLGITVVFIDEDHALADPVYFLREARNGIDHSRAGRGLI